MFEQNMFEWGQMKVACGKSACLSWNALQDTPENIATLLLCLFIYYTNIYGSDIMPGLLNARIPKISSCYYKEHVF